MNKEERYQAVLRDARLGVRRALDEARARAADGEGQRRGRVGGPTMPRATAASGMALPWQGGSATDGPSAEPR